MSNYTKMMMVVLFALTAAACSNKDESATSLDAAIEDAAETAKELGNGAMDKASSLVDEQTMDAAKSKMDGAIGEVKDMATEAMGDMDMADHDMSNMTDHDMGDMTDMAKETIGDAGGLSAEELKKQAEEKAKKALDFGN